MRPVLDRAQIRDFDRKWIDSGVPGIVLMENAGRGAAHLIGLKARPRKTGEAPRTGSSVVGSCVRCADERSLAGLNVLILAGPGNNGGDGFVIARHLFARAANVRVVCLVGVDALKGDAKIACDAMTALGIVLEPLPNEPEWDAMLGGVDVVVDGLLGTGADRIVEGALARLIERVNASPARVIALDIPSGLDAETGAVLGVAIQAEHTVTFAHLKRGLLTTFGQERGGNITVSHIGVPSSIDHEPAAWLLEESDVLARLSSRSRVVHKGSSGRVVLIAGSPGTVGAARLSSRASLRAGAGLVTVMSDAETAAKLEGEFVEVMTHAWGDARHDAALLNGAGALVVGPGLGQADDARSVSQMAWSLGKPLLIDADGLRYLAGEGREAFLAAKAPLVALTPHAGEAAALLDVTISDIESDRFGSAQRLADRHQSVIVLKGSRTIVAAPGHTPVVSAFGSPALATAGSGDVLSGVGAAFMVGASTLTEVFERMQTAVAVHAIAAEKWESEHGDRGLLASEVADRVPDVIAQFVA